RRLHPGHPGGSSDGGVPRLRSDESDASWVSLPRCRGAYPALRVVASAGEPELPARWREHPHHRWRGSRDGQADRLAAAAAPLRGPVPLRLLLIGPPGAGEGTQAARLAEYFGIPAISTGDIFRSNVSEKTALGLQAKAYMDAGDNVPDSLTNDLVRDRLS